MGSANYQRLRTSYAGQLEPRIQHTYIEIRDREQKKNTILGRNKIPSGITYI